MRSLIIIVLTLVHFCLGVKSENQCASSHWPVYAGGVVGGESVTCFIYDPIQKLIIVGGLTNSDDFAPTYNPSSDLDEDEDTNSWESMAFVYALDLDGNWKWGNYFRNSSIFE